MSDNDSPTVPAAPEIDMNRIRDKHKRAYELVPEIGRGLRWYDFPYRVLRWTLTSRRKRLLPWQLRHKLNNGLQFLHSL